MKLPLLGKTGLRLFFWLFLAAFTPLATYGVRVWSLVRQSVSSQIESRITAVSTYKAAQVSRWLEDRGERLEILGSPAQREPYSNAARRDPGGFSRLLRVESTSSINDSLLALDEYTLLRELLRRHAAMGYSDSTYFIPLRKSPASEPEMAIIRIKSEREPGMYRALAGYTPFESEISEIILPSYGLGETGQAYLIDRERVMVSRSRFMNHPSPGTHRMESPAADSGFSRGVGVGAYFSWEGKRVIGAWTPIPGPDWLLIAEIDETEAFAGMVDLRNDLIAIALITLAGVVIAAALLSGSISRPILRIEAVSRQAARGDLTLRSGVAGADEIGRLGVGFDAMITSLEQSQMRLQRSLADLRDQEARLVQSERLAAVGELVASIVHEFRNPLTGVKVNLRLAQRASGGSELAEPISQAMDDSLRIERMLDTLLDYSKPFRPSISRVSLHELLQALLSQRKLLQQTGEIKFDLRASGDVTVEADPELMRAALENLLLNAEQAIGDNPGLITVALVDSGDQAVVSVEDNGGGVHEENVARLFEPFFTTKTAGAGLGLPNVRKIIEAHFGRIEFETVPGSGAKFLLYIPKEQSWRAS